MNMMTILAAAAALTCASAAIAQAATPTSSTSPTANGGATASGRSDGYINKDGKVCRRLPVTGSRIGGLSVCLTQAQWDQEDGKSRRDADHRSGKVASR